MSTEQMQAHAINVGQTFVWHEVNVPDGAAAKEFYTGVFGWGTQEMDMGPEGTYTMFTRNEVPIGGIMPTVGDYAHVPPHWSTYIAVEDVDATVAKIVAKGGQVRVPAFDVPTIGRMCLCEDPQGAVFWVYKGE